MSDNAHLYHAATLKKLVEGGWFSEPKRSEMLKALRSIPRSSADSQYSRPWEDRASSEGEDERDG